MVSIGFISRIPLLVFLTTHVTVHTVDLYHIQRVHSSYTRQRCTAMVLWCIGRYVRFRWYILPLQAPVLSISVVAYNNLCPLRKCFFTYLSAKWRVISATWKIWSQSILFASRGFVTLLEQNFNFYIEIKTKKLIEFQRRSEWSTNSNFIDPL